MGIDELRPLLDRVRGVGHACDLDLLLFFQRHPMSLLTSEQLIASVGYERARVAQSLDGLIEAGYVTRSQSPAHAARLYVLQETGAPTGALTALLRAGSTRAGRAKLLALLDTSPITPVPQPAQARLRATVVKIA